MMKNRMMDEEQDVENVGIMQGFMDSMNEEDDDEGEGEEDEGYSGVDRRPDSPEILMNNLRGDMRSIDARRDELADLVGYAAAEETPEPVLAMLQPILAGQGPAAGAGGGIGALPPSMAMAQGPQPPMMPPPPPPMAPGAPGAEMAPPPGDGGIAALLAGAGGPPPGGAPAQPPLQMAQGGYVQHFQAGSSPAGVTPEDDTEGESGLSMYPPAIVNAARTYASDLLTKSPSQVPTLEALMAKRLPQYEKLVGAEKANERAQSQMLLGLGQRAFNFAANVDDAGRPLRGGFFSRLAGATRSLPSVMGKQIEAMDQIDLKLKTLAMQAAEKDQDEIIKQNTDLLKTKASLFGQVLQAQAKIDAKKAGVGTSIFGKGDWEWNIINMPGMLDRYAQGTTSPEESNLVDSAITSLTTPKVETRFDPVTREPYTATITPPLPSFAARAVADRKALNLPTPSPANLAPTGSNVRREGATGAETDTGAAGAPATSPAGQKPAISLWNDRFNIAGPISAAISAVSGFPGLGDPAAHVTLARQQAEQQAERIMEALLKSTAGSVREQERLGPVINIKPSAFQDPDAYGTRMIALGSTIQGLIQEADAQGRDDSGLRPEDKGIARKKASELRRIYGMLGLPPSVYSEGEFKRFAPGTEVLWMGRTPAKVK